MAKPAQVKRQPKAAPRGRMGSLKKASIWAGVVAIVNETGLKNVLAAATVSVAAPVTATAFVYEVSALRTERLLYEARDRAHYAAIRDQEDRTPPFFNNREAERSEPSQAPDLTHKLDAMISSRSTILDTFGDDPATVAPIYARVIKQMMLDDDATLGTLSSGRPVGDPAAISERVDRLRELHARLSHLAGA